MQLVIRLKELIIRLEELRRAISCIAITRLYKKFGEGE